MSLDRFTNREDIIKTDGPVRGKTYLLEDEEVLKLDVKHIAPKEIPAVELHLYSPGDIASYVAGGLISEFEIVGDHLYINYQAAIRELGVERGTFEVVVNCYKNLLGDEDTAPLYIKNILMHLEKGRLDKNNTK